MPVETILVVDDNEQNCLIAKDSLASAGYVVTSVLGGKEAIESFKERVPDLVLMDIMMPEMDGFETCRQIRALPQGADVPIVFLTSLVDLGTHKRALEVGGDDILTKPFNRTELFMRVRSMMWMRRLRGELRSGYALISSQRDSLIRAQMQKEELFNLIAHDLKNPLQIVLACAQQLTIMKGPIEAPKSLEYIRHITSSAMQMVQMVLNMLDINLNENGVFIPKISEVRLPELIEQVCLEMGLRGQELGISIEHSTKLSVPNILADPDVIRRLLENLIGNAIRYSPKGGAVMVEARTLENDVLELRVRDQGKGIPLEYREKIFEKYVQLDPNCTMHNQGMGLTFCRLAADAHGGRIWVEDNSPQGSCFCIHIPIPKADKPAPVPA
jgi:signal transduction histidine kinase